MICITQLHDALLVTRVGVTKLIGCSSPTVCCVPGLMNLEHHGRQSCGKQPRFVDRRRCRQRARSSTSFVNNTIVQNLGQSSTGKYTDYSTYISVPQKRTLDLFNCFARTPICDRRTRPYLAVASNNIIFSTMGKVWF